MTKFSDFIRAPGTAGPPTQEGIRALGFVLATEVPGYLDNYVRVDAAQTFNSTEKAQGRANLGAVIGTDVQAFSTSLASLAGLTTAADRMAYTTAADTWAVATITSFGRSLLDDADAAAARTTLGLGNVNNTSDADKPISTATQAALDLKAPLASPALTGTPTVPTAAPGTDTTQAASTAFVTAAVSAAAVFTKSYESAEQAITANGALTLAHGLGAEPKIVVAVFVCKTAELGYSVGDKLQYASSNASSGSQDRGIVIVATSTNIEVRYGANILVLSKNAGVSSSLTAANWRLVLRAYA